MLWGVSLERQNEAAPLLSVRDLHIGFDGQQAVRGVSFTIAPGETLGLVGESGSGKSVTSLAMMRLLAPGARVSGSVVFRSGNPANNTGVSPLRETMKPSRSGRDEKRFGDDRHMGVAERDLLMLPEAAMRGLRGREIAMIFQEPMTALNPVMKIGRQIAEAVLAHAPKTPRREVRERVLTAMREVGLPEPERRSEEYPHQFSGGQRQRIVIATAIINKPRLLIADEPTTALDVTVQAQVLALLKSLRERHNLAMLFISHDLAVVAQMADRVAVMRQGEIVEQGSMETVLTQPTHEYTRRLLASAPTMRTDRGLPLATVGRA
jgi:peptide/nickel transport system ATP-binding protein